MIVAGDSSSVGGVVDCGSDATMVVAMVAASKMMEMLILMVRLVVVVVVVVTGRCRNGARRECRLDYLQRNII